MMAGLEDSGGVQESLAIRFYTRRVLLNNGNLVVLNIIICIMRIVMNKVKKFFLILAFYWEF